MKKSILRLTSLVAMSTFALAVVSPSISSAKEVTVAKVTASKTTAKKPTSKTATAKSVTPVSGDTVVATVPCVIDNNFQVLFNGYANGAPILWKLDTGAFAPAINASDAARLKLPNLGTINVTGVTGGSSAAYSSVMNVEIGGVTFPNVPVVVDPSYKGPSLLGYSFFDMNNYDLLVSRKKDEITILK